MRALQPRWRSAVQASANILKQPLGLISLLMLLAIILSDVISESVRRWYNTYSVLVALLVSFVTLAFAASIVDQIIERRSSLRWESVRGITLKGLNDELRSARDILWLALFGRLPYELPQEMSARKRRAVECAQAAQSLWPDLVQVETRTQLNKLLANGNWTPIAAAVVHLATQQIREGLVQWAPMTALAHGDYRVLSPVARVADAIELLEFPLAADLLDVAGCVDLRYREALCDLWCHTLAACVYVEESIVKVLYPARRWTSKARELLSDRDVENLNHWLVSLELFDSDNARQQMALIKMLPNWQGTPSERR